MNAMGTRILAVEDDDRIRAALQIALEDEGYEVQSYASGEDALSAFRADRVDLVLVDLLLPGISGFDVCRELRKQSEVPIVIVTARADTHDVVGGLEAGADDYVTKPFVVKELSARIRALLRRSRSASAAPDGHRFGDVEILPEAGVVRRDGVEISLTKTEFHLLCELALNQGIVLTREVLLDKVCGYDYFGDGRLVDAHIRRLRTKIERDPADPELIVTVRGLGYRMQHPG
jgi:DNA-binding response OmpR family regulator